MGLVLLTIRGDPLAAPIAGEAPRVNSVAGTVPTAASGDATVPLGK